MQLRNFVFTLNNWNQEELDKILDLPIKYMIYGKEGESEGKTPHLQGYVELEKRLTFKSIIAKTTKRIHIEPRKGTQLDAIQYCKKELSYFEVGECKEQGYRSDLREMRYHIMQGCGIRDLIENDEINLNVNTIRTAEKLLQYYDKPRDFEPTVLWFYGKTGTGKTLSAFKALPGAYFNANSTGKWWPGYDGQEDIIMDDIRPESLEFMYLIKMLHGFPFQIEDKGVIRQFRGRRIIITAPSRPEYLYREARDNNFEDMNQLLRRIEAIIEF